MRAGALVLAALLALSGCASGDRVTQREGMFGVRYTERVSRPYVYGGGEFCVSAVSSGPERLVWYEVFTRASPSECEALIAGFDTHSDSREPFPDRPLLYCRSTGPYACESVMRLHEELAERFAQSGVEGVGAASEDGERLREFFQSRGRLLIRVMFGFDPRQPLSLECAYATRQLDVDGYSSITAIICRDAARSWIVDATLTEQ